ncbi:hypothetical protein ACLOJK_031944 [Asimina triloba]
MHRSASTSRASDEFFVNVSPQIKASPGYKSAEIDQLPTYSPLSDVGKKETSRLKTAENAVHVIPLVLVVCGIILWFFSHPVVLENKTSSLVTRVEGMRITGHGNQTRVSPPLDTELDPAGRIMDDEGERSAQKKSE